MDLNFKVKEQIINRTDNNTIVNLSENYLQLCFTFQSNDWTGLTKFILFKHGEKSTRIGLTEDKVIVPASLLTGNRLVFSLYGLDTSNDEVYRITTNQIRLHLLDSGYTSEVDDIIDEEETDIVEEIYIAINNTETVCKEYTDTGLESKADTEHTHTKSEITDFSHTHTLSDITDNDKYRLILTENQTLPEVTVYKNDEIDETGEFTIHSMNVTGEFNETYQLEWNAQTKKYTSSTGFANVRAVAYCTELDQYSNMLWIDL